MDRDPTEENSWDLVDRVLGNAETMPLGAHEAHAAERTPERSARDIEKRMGLRPGDAQLVSLDDHIAFGCDRSGYCCTGRHIESNLITPVEAAIMYQTYRELGILRQLDDFLPGLVGRVIGHGARYRSRARPRPDDQESCGTERGHFLGLAFRMVPDSAMQDGDRCVNLTHDSEGQYACRLHGTRGQPSQCALAPIGMVVDPDPNTAPVFVVL